jgi:hypothetical protein
MWVSIGGKMDTWVPVAKKKWLFDKRAYFWVPSVFRGKHKIVRIKKLWFQNSNPRSEFTIVRVQ